MENIILNIWIEIKNNLKVRSTEKSVKEDCAFLIMEIDENGDLRKKPLIVKGRKVFDNSGRSVDFGDAYPIVTETGKMMITKKFISTWL